MFDKSLSAQMQELDIGSQFQIGVSQKSRDRLYLCWRNSNMVECKMIGPQTKCFCNHRFKEHEYLNPKGKKAPCKAIKCKCKCFDYIPTHGAYDFKCLCKHSFKEHDCISKQCQNPKCKICEGFASAWTCSCGSKFIDHETVIESYEQRKAKGKSVNDMMRMNSELNSAIEQGSLLKPIKQDPQVRIKSKILSNPYIQHPKENQTKFKEEDDELQEYKFDHRPLKKHF